MRAVDGIGLNAGDAKYCLVSHALAGNGHMNLLTVLGRTDLRESNCAAK